MNALATRKRAPALGDRLADRRARSKRVTTSTDRGVFDILKRRRETEDAPPDLCASMAALEGLIGKTEDLNALRSAAMEVSVAAAHIVCRLPPPDLNLADEE